MMFQNHSSLNLLDATKEQGSLIKCKILGAKTAVPVLYVEMATYKEQLPSSGQPLAYILPDDHIILVRLPA